MTQAPSPSALTKELPQLLNITQVAETLGVNIRHVRRLIYERRIPFIKWGHLIRFDPDEITQWLDSHRHAGKGPSSEARRAVAER